MLNFELPENHRHWSTKYTFIVIVMAVAVWVIYAVISPGKDFYGAYTWMVINPEMYPQVADYPWTLNPPWMVPFMAPFITLPGRAGFLLFMAAMIAMIIYGAYIFGGRAIPTLLSAQMWWILWWGQLEGWGVIALVFGWAALAKRSWALMFLALTIGAFKPQVGFIPVLILWLWSGKDRWKSMACLICLAIVSVFIWGPWPLWYLQGIFKFVGDNHFQGWNSSLGYYFIPLFLPALLLPLSREKKLMAVTATALIVSPYLPYYSTILLLCFNIPWWTYIFAFIGYIPAFYKTYIAWNAIVLLPISVLLWIYSPYFIQGIKRYKFLRGKQPKTNE